MHNRRIKYERFVLPALALSAACHLLAALIPAGAVDFILRRETELKQPVRFEVVHLQQEPPQVAQAGGHVEHVPRRLHIVGTPPVPQIRRAVNWTLAMANPELGPVQPPTTDRATPTFLPPAPAVENPDSVALMKSYLAGILARIEGARRYPEVARRMRQQGEVEVGFAIERDGEVRNPARLVEPSRFNALNRAARSSVRSSTPFPPLPDCIGADTLGVTVRIVFRLN